ncbi:Solute carrier family 12 member, partial [Brachionus plicatilis]
MFKFLRRRANHHDDNISDIVQETTSINISDSAPILNRNFDLTNNSDSLSFHDLRRSNQGDDVNLIKRSLRTIPGVFCPVALSMSSVAVFMRVGFIVGHAGILDSLGLYALAFTIFVLTGLSICAISTNGAIQGGGVYYMISRTLGPEIGGSIGALFFIANAIASAFNATGLVEAILNNFGTSKVEGGLPESFGFRVLYGS